MNDTLDPKTFTIRNAMARLERLGSDPCASVLEEKPDLAGVLQRLSAVLAQGQDAPEEPA